MSRNSGLAWSPLRGDRGAGCRLAGILSREPIRTMTHADNNQLPRLLGMSRDTCTGVAPSPDTIPPEPVILRLWGATRQDIERAARLAEDSVGARMWRVAEIIPTTGAPCPIPSADTLTLGQGADWDAAWAAYPAWSLTEVRP